MPIIEHDDVVDALSSDRSNEPLDIRILPRTSPGRHDLLDAHVLDAVLEHATVDTIAIAHEVAWHMAPRKRLYDLLRRPCGGRVRRHVEVQHAASVVSKNETKRISKRTVGTTKKSTETISDT